jgi:hypothetical protein
MTTPEPPSAITLPNSSRRRAVPYRSTLRIVSGAACDGETPAARMTPWTSPSELAFSTRASTETRDDTSTVVVVTSKPASLNVFAAASAFS